MRQVIKTQNAKNLKVGDVVTFMKVEQPGIDKDSREWIRTVVFISGVVTNLEHRPEKQKVKISINTTDGRDLSYLFDDDSDSHCITKNGIQQAVIYLFDGIITLNQ